MGKDPCFPTLCISLPTLDTDPRLSAPSRHGLTMSTLSWYWHRLWAMSPVEMALHVRKKFREAADQRRGFPELSGSLAGSGLFPKLPPAVSAPRPLREALHRDATRILLG